MYRGMTLINDPRVSESGFYKQMMETKPNVALTTGSLWGVFFRNIERELKKGKDVDLSYAKMWIIGGEGTKPAYFKKWNELMEMCGSKTPLYSGYGMSEVFSVLSVETLVSSYDARKIESPVISVGIPYPGTNVKIVDKLGNELRYGERGELLIKSNTAMKEYYNKPELTSKVVSDGWVHTGDIFSVNEDGMLFLWGRADDKITLPNNEEMYLFDIANKIKSDKDVADAFVNAMPLGNGNFSLVVHIVFKPEFIGSREEKYKEIDSMLKGFLPNNLIIDGYKEHLITFKCSPATVKKDRKGLMK